MMTLFLLFLSLPTDVRLSARLVFNCKRFPSSPTAALSDWDQELTPTYLSFFTFNWVTTLAKYWVLVHYLLEEYLHACVHVLAPSWYNPVSVLIVISRGRSRRGSCGAMEPPFCHDNHCCTTGWLTVQLLISIAGLYMHTGTYLAA